MGEEVVPPRRAMLVLNPNAGKGRFTDEARQAAAARPWLDLLETSCREDCRPFVDRAIDSGYDTVIVGGGDGTVHDVLNALDGRFEAIRLAIMPLGTANDLARTLDLPRTPLAALDAIERGVERRIDLIRATSSTGSHDLLNAATGGFSETLNAKLTDEVKERWGMLAYIRAALDALEDAAVYRTNVMLDDEPLSAETSAVVVANGRYAGGISVAPEAELDDRRMDVSMITAQTLADRARLLARAALGTAIDDPHLLFAQVKRFEITSDPPMHFNGDGEPIGRTPITFELLPGALRLITAREI